MTSDGINTYTYDAEGNITAVSGNASATYVYNALNQRVRTTVNSGTPTEFVFNANGQRVSEWNGSTRAQLKGKYYWGGTPVAYYTTAASSAGAGAHFEHQDWLGTERMRTSYNSGNNPTYAVEGTFTSEPWGDAQTVASGTDLDANHYAALDYDAETATDHAQFRQYGDTPGNWKSPDPYYGSYDQSNPQSMNRYVYALDNPLSNIDPSGLECVWDDGSYDGEYDPTTGEGNPGGCAQAGGTWVELGMDGGWTDQSQSSTGLLTITIDVIGIDVIGFTTWGTGGLSTEPGSGPGGNGPNAPNNPQQNQPAKQEKQKPAWCHKVAGLFAGEGLLGTLGTTSVTASGGLIAEGTLAASMFTGAGEGLLVGAAVTGAVWWYYCD
jgi:RHS repeat-associated protein